MLELAEKTNASIENELIEDMAGMTHDPVKWLWYSFPWGDSVLKDLQPEDWQIEILEKVRDGLLTPFEAIRVAVASGHGIGKSALVAWIILWSMSTFEDTRGIVTANTENQLMSKTWPELAKWYQLFIAKHWFKLTATALYSIEPEHEKTWRFDAHTWSENKTEAFAGLHNKGKRIVLILDEASAIPVPIWEVSEGALTDENTEILWFAFGNPTRNDGKFKDCFGIQRHRWFNKQIDSRTVRITNKKQINQWVEDYGEDSDFVRVRVRGVFPNVSERQFIPSSYVEMARGKALGVHEYNFAAKIIAVEPAWTGQDEIVIGMRQGLAFQILSKFPKNDNDFKLASLIAQFEDEHQADAVFIDFGYGTGPYSAGLQLGRKWTLVEFGSGSNNPQYLNKRVEMWGAMKDWLKSGGAIPNDPILCAELVAPECDVIAVGKNAGKIKIESKDDMKARAVASPNRADCLAITFAFPVKPKSDIEKTFGVQMQFVRSDKDFDVLA